jgi:hypothetical protein
MQVRGLRRWWLETAIVFFALASLGALGGYPLARYAVGAPIESAWSVVHILWIAGAAFAVLTPGLGLLRYGMAEFRRAREKDAASPPPLAVLVIYELIGFALMIAGLCIVAAKRPWEGLLAVSSGASVVMLAVAYLKERARS